MASRKHELSSSHNTSVAFPTFVSNITASRAGIFKMFQDRCRYQLQRTSHEASSCNSTVSRFLADSPCQSQEAMATAMRISTPSPPPTSPKMKPRPLLRTSLKHNHAASGPNQPTSSSQLSTSTTPPSGSKACSTAGNASTIDTPRT
jgi:hypothetical protein